MYTLQCALLPFRHEDTTPGTGTGTGIGIGIGTGAGTGTGTGGTGGGCGLGRFAFISRDGCIADAMSGVTVWLWPRRLPIRRLRLACVCSADGRATRRPTANVSCHSRQITIRLNTTQCACIVRPYELAERGYQKMRNALRYRTDTVPSSDLWAHLGPASFSVVSMILTHSFCMWSVYGPE